MNYFTKIITIGFVALSFVSFGQLANQQSITTNNNSSVHEKCGTHGLHLEKMETDDTYRQQMEEFEIYTHSAHDRVSQTNLKIPIVVHVIGDGTSLTDITDAQIEQAILAMNQMYRKVPGTKGDGNGVDVGFEFALAVRDPDGNCTSGITRYDNSGDGTYTTSGVFRNTAGISDATLKSLVVWDQTSYYNIWLVSEIDNNEGGAGVQGYATFAGSHGTSSDGAVILASNFENVESTTGVHEIGHSFNLYHTFQGDGAGCPSNGDCTLDGDLVCDTPPHERSSSDCVVGTNGCDGGSSTELFIHNYMDYSSDACQNMFTQGQKDRMIDALNFTRSSFLASNGNMSLVPPAVANVDFYASKSVICQGEAVSFTDISSCTPNTFMDTTSWAGISFLWSVTNGVDNYNSTLQNPIFTFPNTGTYDITLQVTNGNGATSLTKQGHVVVGVSPTAAGCSPTSNNEGNFWRTIHNVTFNTINNTTSQYVNVGYTDFACEKTTIVAPGSNPISVTTNATSANCVFEVYIDYDNNGVFDNPSELAYSGANTSGGIEVSNGTITIPGTAVTDVNLRMRVINESGTITANERNCVTPFFIGDVEDYGVMISGDIAEVSIVATPSNTITYGTSTTFTATPVNGGGAPTYAWYLNGELLAGEIASTYVTSTLVDNDEVYCEMTSNLVGVIASPATSNTVTMTVTGAPLSEFSVSQTQVCAGEALNFTDESLLDPTSWSWTFTDGTPSSSTDQNPTVSYAVPGTYEVVLTASNGLGAGTTETKTGYITVLASPATICSFTRDNAPNFGIGLTNVSLNEIDNSTVYDGDVFNDYSCTQVTNLIANTNYDISATVGGFNDQWLRVYIDYDNSGSFEPGELVFSPANGRNTLSGSFTTDASPVENELLRMRVITDFVNTTEGSCTSPLDYGQVEDYSVIFSSACTAPTIDTEPSAEVVCENSNSTFTVAATGSSLVYTWQESLDGTNFNNITNGGIYSGANSATLTLTNTPIANDTYEYRCFITTACGDVTSAEVGLTVNAIDDASYSYAAASYCANDTDPTPTITGLAGGGFTFAPAGLSINAGTGAIDVSATTPGSYTVTYTTVGSCPNSSDVSVDVNGLDDASFGYSSGSYCVNAADPTPTITGVAGGGFTSAPGGLSINAGTGAIDLSLSTPGTYTITYTTVGACASSSDKNVTVNAMDDASFSYASAAYCVNDSDPTPTITGLAGGGFTFAPAGLVINAGTGTIDLSASTPGSYTITYTTTGTCPNISNVNVDINGMDDASFNYSSASYCISESDPSPTITGLAGGGFTFAPAGLVINAGSGLIDVSNSTEASYTVTYTTVGSCPNSSNESVAITSIDDASFNYSAASYCSNDSDPTATITGAAGGSFSSLPLGLSINGTSGLIDVSASTPGAYTITYTTSGVCANNSDVAITINASDDASFSYSAAAYCVNDSDPTATITGLAGGGFTSLPAGLSINAASGLIDVSASTPGAYTVTYTTVGTCPNSSNIALAINGIDDASFNYSAASYCVNDSDPTATITGLAGGGFTSLPAGLSINAASGLIDVSASTPGIYTVTYTTAGSCPNNSNVAVTINAMDDASFSYALNSYETTDVDPTPTVTGLVGGTFSSLPVGLDINPVSGEIDLSNSVINDYVITYTTSGICSNAEVFNLSVINSVPTTTVNPTFCGQTVSSLTQAILSVPVAGATNYRYRITPTDMSAPSQIYTRNSHSYSLKLDWFGNGAILYNTSYELEVAVFVGGSWSEYGNPCQIITPAIPLTKLQAVYCGQTVSGLDQTLLSEEVPGATNYRYRATPTDMSAPSIVYTRNSHSYSMKLDWFGLGQILHGTSYEIEVASYVEGAWTSYGVPCQVITPNLPTVQTKLQDAHCGSTVSSFNQTLFSEQIAGATNYRYRATPTDMSASAIVYNRNSNSYSMKLAWFGIGAILYNTSYEIEVAVYIDGAWTDYGAACQIITPAIPETKLQDPYCGQQVASYYSPLLSVQILGATNYKYRATPTDMSAPSVEFIRNSHSYSLKLAWFGTGVIQNNTSYEIEVAAFVDGTWRAYGDACQIISPAAPMSSIAVLTDPEYGTSDLDYTFDDSEEILNDDFVEEVQEELTFSIFPNPSTGLFTVQSEINDARLRIVSIDGRVITPPTILTNGSKSIDLSSVEKGVYLVVLEKGNQQLIKRVIIQ